jgi:hypothetical protein
MDRLEKLCIKWLNENYKPMEPFIMKEYPDYIFHMKNGQCILQYNKRNGYVYVSYREIWSFFERVFSMSYRQIKDVTKIWVVEHYKMGVTSTNYYTKILDSLVEEHYKMGVTSTDKKQLEWVKKVEEHYENKIQTTNDQNKFYFERDVEELYNQHTNG